MPEVSSLERLLTERQVAERLQVQVATLRRWRWLGHGLPFVRVGRCVRYEPAAVAAFIEQGRVAA